MVRRLLEGMLAAGQPGEALEMAVEYFAGPVDPPEAVWVALHACKASGMLADWGQALVWAERGVALNRGADLEATGWLHFRLGTALMYTGDVYRSERELQRYLQIAPSIPLLKRHLGEGLFNLGILARCLQQADEELAYLNRAEAAFAEYGRHNRVLRCLIEKAWTFMMTGQLESARNALERVDAAFAEHGDPESAVDAGTYWAWYHYLTGNLDRSSSLCEELLQLDMKPGQRADILWVSAQVMQGFGDLVAARTQADRAYDEALSDHWLWQVVRIEELRRSLPASTVGR